MAEPYQGTGEAAPIIANGAKQGDKNAEYLCDLEQRRVPYPRSDCPYNITPQTLNRCKVGADEVIVAVEDPNMYQNISGMNRVEQARAMGGKEVIDPLTKRQPYQGMGNVAMAIPREVWEAQQAQTDRESEEYQKPFKPNREGQLEADEAFDRTNRDYFRQAAAINSENWAQSGIVGDLSPTHGLSQEDGLEYLEKQAKVRKMTLDDYTDQIANEYRRGARHTGQSKEEWQKFIGGGKTTWGVGDTGFGRNPNSAVAQAARSKAK